MRLADSCRSRAEEGLRRHGREIPIQMSELYWESDSVNELPEGVSSLNYRGCSLILQALAPHSDLLKLSKPNSTRQHTNDMQSDHLAAEEVTKPAFTTPYSKGHKYLAHAFTTVECFLRKDASMSSSVLPRVSGMKTTHTALVNRHAPLNRKYTPYVE